MVLLNLLILLLMLFSNVVYSFLDLHLIAVYALIFFFSLTSSYYNSSKNIYVFFQLLIYFLFFLNVFWGFFVLNFSLCFKLACFTNNFNFFFLVYKLHLIYLNLVFIL